MFMDTFDARSAAVAVGRAHPAAFSCTCLQQGVSVVIVAAGEVDRTSAQRLWNSLAQALSSSASVIVDCALITFCDSVGAQALLRAQRTAHDLGAFFALASVSDRLARMVRCGWSSQSPESTVSLRMPNPSSVRATTRVQPRHRGSRATILRRALHGAS
jgi:anti-anti-sigma factor